jgi:hypothetical protein
MYRKFFVTVPVRSVTQEAILISKEPRFVQAENSRNEFRAWTQVSVAAGYQSALKYKMYNRTRLQNFTKSASWSSFSFNAVFAQP